ncbi:hypothetical protein [Xanthomonas campestris]|jgi:hypothetical protein|uniref:hypothetical protein n=1 Tax=Xanthomonas campestris TaxID=339 RepID=UPI0011C04321|nr:hypothetical protein [Xanthomonas campestris]MEA9491548.1 hypothetical protein [Xanthomonas campestris]MEA9510132.1 hypothetical protein [Xanthomonas campestris]MEA9577112.1 hypothetical protein [Xanthomonas campestris]MEB2113303.1 hypothetical protein [Xanthomonas campestris pv. campestris]
MSMPVSEPVELVTEAAMLAASGIKVVVFVEGPSDKRVFGKAFRERVSIIPAGGWSALESIFSENVAATWPGSPLIFGVSDRDYRIALNKALPNESLVYSHFRDIECEMIDSEALEILLYENIAESKLTDIAIEKLRAQAIEAATILGKVRFWAAEKGVPLSFSSLDVSKIVDASKENLMPSKIWPHLRGAQKAGVKLPTSLDECSQLVAREPYATRLQLSLRIARGHDVAAYIVFRLKKGLGKRGCVDDVESFESQLRVAFSGLKSGPTVEKLKELFRSNGVDSLIR